MNSQIPEKSVASVDAVEACLEQQGYIATADIAMAVYLAHHLSKPVLVEGPAGVARVRQFPRPAVSYAPPERQTDHGGCGCGHTGSR